MRVQQQGWGRKQKGSVSAEVARTEPAGSSMTDQGKFPAILAKFLFALKSWRWMCFPQTMHLTDAACCSCGLGSPHGLAALPLVVRASVGNGRTSRFPAGMTTKTQRQRQGQRQKQIPCGNDNQKSKSKGKGNSKGKGKSRFPAGMTTKKAKAKARTRATAKATAKAKADSLRE